MVVARAEATAAATAEVVVTEAEAETAVVAREVEMLVVEVRSHLRALGEAVVAAMVAGVLTAVMRAATAMAVVERVVAVRKVAAAAAARVAARVAAMEAQGSASGRNPRNLSRIGSRCTPSQSPHRRMCRPGHIRDGRCTRLNTHTRVVEVADTQVEGAAGVVKTAVAVSTGIAAVPAVSGVLVARETGVMGATYNESRLMTSQNRHSPRSRFRARSQHTMTQSRRHRRSHPTQTEDCRRTCWCTSSLAEREVAGMVVEVRAEAARVEDSVAVETVVVEKEGAVKAAVESVAARAAARAGAKVVARGVAKVVARVLVRAAERAAETEEGVWAEEAPVAARAAEVTAAAARVAVATAAEEVVRAAERVEERVEATAEGMAGATEEAMVVAETVAEVTAVEG